MFERTALPGMMTKGQGLFVLSEVQAKAGI